MKKKEISLTECQEIEQYFQLSKKEEGLFLLKDFKANCYSVFHSINWEGSTRFSNGLFHCLEDEMICIESLKESWKQAKNNRELQYEN